MKYSKYFGKTIKDNPSDATLISHILLHKAGYIRESTAGRYFFLPLGLRVQQNIMRVIKEEMDRAGAQEMLSPVLHPLDLWKETNRNNEAGFELSIIKDRRDMEFALGGTAEEMFVDVVRKFQLSYKDLPFNIYQFSTKFRDELRARGGLLRVREFIMKDAYSFDRNEEEFKKEYKNMEETYTRIFSRLGLKTTIVESDGGYIGGEYCHEFVVESPVGESTYFVTEDSTYASHEDVAVFDKQAPKEKEEMKAMAPVDAVRGPTMQDGVKLHNMPLWKQIKDVLYVDETGRYILAVIRGDYDVNEVKLKKLVSCISLRSATEAEIRTALKSEPGFLSPVGIKERTDSAARLVIVVDDSIRTVTNLYGGANEKNKDLFNVNIDRDFKADIEGDIAAAKEGYTHDGKRLIKKKGIEVGNIFQLGYHYSSKMKNATYIDVDGKEKQYYMGCYGIGIGRTLATLVEVFHDEKGIKWPDIVAPFIVHLIGLNLDDSEVKKQVDSLYRMLTEKGIQVLFDDREGISAGAKFADSDLIGIPYRVVVSKKTGDQIEVKRRDEHEATYMPVEELLKQIGR